MWRTMNSMTTSLVKNKILQKRGLKSFIYLAFLSFVFLISCYKPAGEIGVEVQPNNSLLQVFWTDTAMVYAYSVPDDTVRTDGLSTTLLGSLMDPTFGHTTASFYSQFMLENTGHRFGNNPQVDSLVLQLRYTGGSYGDTTTYLTARVYQMEESIYLDSTYTSNIDIPVYPTDYADFTFVPKPHDSILVGDDTASAALRINLSNYNLGLADYLINIDTMLMDSNDLFIDYFKGLYITTDPVSTGGSLINFDLFSNRSLMILYYSNDEEDSLDFEYPITVITQYASKYEHDLSAGSPDFVQQVVEGDTSLGSNKYYVQGVAGVASVIKIPNMPSWNRLGNVALNEAKLVLAGNTEDTLYAPPIKLALAEIGSDGTYSFLLDESGGQTNYFGGEYKASTRSYTFRITRYLQSLIDDPTKENNGLYLIVRGGSIYPNRFVFNGNAPESDTTRLHLEITYTDLD
ncbi:MAG: hypothetical protein C0591_13440 [Marinilabiliales bacterium]|nr:MAG: hypothetical protein C0591_13440 [Marinilabiliales bacterium]